MREYQVISRKYRPQKFSDVYAQEPLVQTLKNAIKHQKLAHAYLFSGSKGTGKTTLARIFAKAVNCMNLSPEGEPCCVCATCKEITLGISPDVLEIDGASNRGIDDIRKIKDNVGYRAASSYKIYIIDEVHMLTKEAFNALLKTLEEPPPQVKFILATTEPHKVLPTIISRCQRFNFARIPLGKIKEKLQSIALDLGQSISEEALMIIAKRAQGGLRDAESFLEQIISFHEGNIDTKVVTDVLGIMPEEALFELDYAGKEGRLVKAFEIAHTLFSEGKDFQHFVEMLGEHYRNLLLLKISKESASLLELQTPENAYIEVASFYTKEQLLDILDDLIHAEQSIRDAPSCKVALEALLLRIMRTHKSLPIELIVKRLVELERNIGQGASNLSQGDPQTEYVPIKEKEISPPLPPKAQKSLEAQNLNNTPPLQDKKEPSPFPAPTINSENRKEPYFYDTMLQFATIEFEGRLKRSQQFHDQKKQ